MSIDVSPVKYSDSDLGFTRGKKVGFWVLFLL